MVKVRRTACVLAGAAGMYFLDPSMGRRRRAAARDKVRTELARRRQSERSAMATPPTPAQRSLSVVEDNHAVNGASAAAASRS